MQFLDEYFLYDIGSEVSGLTSELNIFYLQKLLEKQGRNIIVLTSSLYEANKIYNDLSNIMDNICFFPMDDFLSSMIIAASPELKYKRLETLDKLKSDEKNIVVTNLMGYLKFLPKVGTQNIVEINVGDTIRRDDLVAYFSELGYKTDSLVTASGEMAVRGFIVDIYPIEERHPIRIEFDGNVIESIRYFDENNQLSFGNLNNIKVKAIEEVATDEVSSLFDYAKNPIVVYIDWEQIKASYQKLCEDILEYKEKNEINDKLMYELEDIRDFDKIYVNLINSGKNDLHAKSIINYNSNFEKLVEDYYGWKKQGKEVYFYLSNDGETKTIKEYIPDASIVKQMINHGFILDKYVVISEFDIENTIHQVNNYKNNFHIGKKVKDYNQLEKGDYVVHIAHGIGKYQGITTLTVRGAEKDFLTIEYLGGDKIYVPVEKISTIYKYTGKDGVVPKLNSLSSNAWEKTKKYVQGKIKDISEELIRLYKERLALKKIPYKDYPEEKIFASSFKYTLTKDQQKSIIDIDSDLKSDIPMDRLLCGDVGFGKTEVAMRAMFKTIVNNHQVMYLCPTTILSKQQYNVAIDRFKDWPVSIRLLNRYTSTKETHQIIDDFQNGKIDILFGTHRILSEDVKPKDLGLLVVDEEQRFGVTHKEKIKQLKKDVNVLTLSATPIPRTLKMALSGLRNLSMLAVVKHSFYIIELKQYLIMLIIYIL